MIVHHSDGEFIVVMPFGVSFIAIATTPDKTLAEQLLSLLKGTSK